MAVNADSHTLVSVFHAVAAHINEPLRWVAKIRHHAQGGLTGEKIIKIGRTRALDVGPGIDLYRERRFLDVVGLAGGGDQHRLVGDGAGRKRHWGRQQAQQDEDSGCSTGRGF